MLEKKITELVAGDEIQGFYLIRECSPRISSGNKLYFDIQLMDQSGEINAKYWEAQESEIPVYTVGTVVKLRASVQMFQNKLQVRISKMRPSVETDGVRTEDFVASAPWEGDWMLEQVENYIQKMNNDDLKTLSQGFVDLNREKLLYYPAAKSNHHAIRSGLLYHMLRMLQTGEKLLEVYQGLNKDLLYTGIILHDMAKIQEMNAGTLGIVTEYSREGQLLGHLIQGITAVDRLGRQLGVAEEWLLLVQHMILSHHYEPEFGSPKKPMIPEGELLHFIDMIDARMYDMENALSGISEGEFTDPVWSLERRRLYKPTIGAEAREEDRVVQ